MKTIIIVLILALILGSLFIISSNHYNLSTKEGRTDFAKTYFGWIGQLGKNLYSITSYSVKLDWTPKTS